ncbi:MAG: substrate-binding domain-containing protein [Paludibacteraceae bacterium]|nr:substrate-binding domain-containing protein [Paludibacteraceae bacterium]
MKIKNTNKIIAIIVAAALSVNGLMAQKMKGSDTVLPLAQKQAEAFMKKNPSARVTVTGGGTGVGILALMDGNTDIAMASRKIKFDERMKLQVERSCIVE